MTPTLDARRIYEPILRNYDEHVLHFLRLLRDVSCHLAYEGPSDFRDHVRDRTTYDCCVRFADGKRKKLLKSVLPVMIGSTLDACVRKRGLRTFDADRPPLPFTREEEDATPFVPADIATGFFLIQGIVQHLPYFFTNDPTRTHVIRNSVVRCYTYDARDRGKELSYYADAYRNHRRGDVVVSLNDGTESDDAQGFFEDCPHPIDPVAYMSRLYREGPFEIDHIANKIVVSPGQLLVKLFVKYLYQPLRERAWAAVKQKHAMVVRSIQTGNLLHVLSRKTLYQKETGSAPKMVAVSTENHREVGAGGEVYVEKSSGCYRDVSMQTYPLHPYLSHMIVRQLSHKVKSGTTPPFHPSCVGFFCLLGTLETKNVGRTNMLVRNSYVSTGGPTERVYELLRLEPRPGDGCYVVVNEACVPVSRRCLERLDLPELKRSLRYVECYRKGDFVHVRYKAGLLFKRMHDDTWVTAMDEPYWARLLLGLATKEELVDRFGYDYVTGHLVDLNPYFHHNSFPKNVLAFNALKNALLATDDAYSRYFMEGFSAYAPLDERHHAVVCPPVDAFSERFVLRLPRVRVAYASWKGYNQEDCIVVRKGLRAFDAYRFYTLRVRFRRLSAAARVVFHPVRGDPDDDDPLVGTLACHSPDENDRLEAIHVSNHVRVTAVDSRQLRVTFERTRCRVVEFDVTSERLIVSLDRFHASGTGDKLCSRHGQKGVMRIEEDMPVLDGDVVPDLVVGVYGAYRMTCGQWIEGRDEGGGRDAVSVRISDGGGGGGSTEIRGCPVFYAYTLYFDVMYWASEHHYAPRHWQKDKVTKQSVKGRRREGGMRMGNMEVNNGLRGNGLAACAEEKLLEHGDRTVSDGAVVPNSVRLCAEDAAFFKCRLRYRTEASVATVSADVAGRWTDALPTTHPTADGALAE